MGIVNSDFLAALLTSFRALYADAFLAAQAPTVYPRIAMEIPSTTLTESYNWLGTVPVMREWIDQRQSGGLYPYTYSLTNKHYEATVDVDRDTLDDDRLGMISPRIRQLGMEVPRYIDNCCVVALVNGAVAGNVCYDGVVFYSASHVVGAQAAQTNLYTSTGVTLVLLQADFSGAKAQMRNVKDDQGRPMNILADFILCAPAQEQVFAQLLTAAMIPAGAVAASMSNTFIGQADMGVSPYVTASTWHLLCTKMAVKPLIFQNRKSPEFISLAKPDDPLAFMSRRFYYGVDTRFAVGYGLWETAIKVA
jgi:phage major head subunit gpT-like protein